MAIAKTRGERTKKVDGNEIIYRFFQDLIESETAFTIQKLLDYAIFLPSEAAKRFPILRPGVIRDTRKKLSNDPFGRNDDWGRADSRGYIRDDNSLLKSIPRVLSIESQITHLNGKLLGKGWVASHIWRETRTIEKANSHPWLNSFIPNLVWLPRQIAKLSDRDGSVLQRGLKILSQSLYKNIEFKDADTKAVVDFCWDELVISEELELKPAVTSQFVLSQEWISRNEEKLRFFRSGVLSGDEQLLKKGYAPGNYFESTGFGKETFFDNLKWATKHIKLPAETEDSR